MTLVETEAGDDVWVGRDGEGVLIEAQQDDQSLRGFINITLTPGQAIRLSRALVKAAAEALGVGIEMPHIRTKEQHILDIRAKAATLPEGPL